MLATPYLNPYLRPILRDGVVLFDNGITQALDPLSPLEVEVVRALWWPPAAPIKLADVCSKRGEEAVLRAIQKLERTLYVFPNAQVCEAVFDKVLDDALASAPFVDQVELTNVCPMRCGFCPRGIPNRVTRPTGYMDLALFERLLEQLPAGQARYRWMEMHHLGESLLHPRVVEFFEAAARRGVPTELSANPSLLSPELSTRLLRTGIKRFVLAVDGVDDATMAAVRGPRARYGEAERNVEALLREAASLDSPPMVVLQMLTLHRNRHQRHAFLARWGRTGFPFVRAYVKPLEGPDPDLDPSEGSQQSYLCTYPWRSVVVLWDGRVVPCCHDADARYVLGDLRTQTLEEIWQGPQAQLLRASHRMGAFAPGHLCAGCGWSRRRFAAEMMRRHPDKAVENPLQW
jgi:radical SAM protein with 4Fe4S-binding SPASM domain